MHATAPEHIMKALVALAELADLVALTALVERLDEQARPHLAPRPTVTSHLMQAQQHLAGLRRTLTHATVTLAYNSAQRSPLAAASSREASDDRRDTYGAGDAERH
jgi:hypothetical protein